MAGRETYDVSAKEKRILEHRANRRAMLRQEYLKQIGNPYKMSDKGDGGVLFDYGINRYNSMKATALEHFRPNPKTGLFGFWAMLVPMALAMYIIIPSRDRQEERYRTGQISYRDREFKFT